MTTDTLPNRLPSARLWAGYGLSALVLALLLADAGVALFAPRLLAADMAATGFAAGTAPVFGVILLIALACYAVPRTAAIGAVLLTGFLGGAICAHLRVDGLGSPPQLICLLLGVAAWGGLFLRDRRVAALL